MLCDTPDVNQIIAKERGIIMNVVSPSMMAKLRLLIEVCSACGVCKGMATMAGNRSLAKWSPVLRIEPKRPLAVRTRLSDLRTALGGTSAD